MVDIQNWDAIPDAAEYERPVPGGYIGVSCDYLDVETPKQRVLAADEFLAQLR